MSRPKNPKYSEKDILKVLRESAKNLREAKKVSERFARKDGKE